MVRKTRKHIVKPHAASKKGVQSIPELRRAFEHIEQFVDSKLAKKESREQICQELRKEWVQTFHKDLKKVAADAFIQDRATEFATHPTRRRTIRKGGSLISSPIAGAPLDYTTRAGIYLAPGQIPNADGGLPLTNQKGGVAPYGSFVEYVDRGFFNPEIAQSYDPVKTQATWPTPPRDLGSNVFTTTKPQSGGDRYSTRYSEKKRASRRKIRGGNPFTESELAHAFQSRLIPASAPPSALQDLTTFARGQPMGASPDQVQRQPPYLLK